MSCGELRGTTRGVQRHRTAGTPRCPACRRAAAAERMLYRVLNGQQRGCYVPLGVLGELLRCASPEVLLLVQELMPAGVVDAAEEFLRLQTEES